MQKNEIAATYELSLYVGLIGNPHLTDKEKVGVSAYLNYALRAAKDHEGFFYYSCRAIAKIMGGNRIEEDKQCSKEQSFSSVHTALQKHGYIYTRALPQKVDKTRKSYFDKCAHKMFFTRSIDLGSSKSARGGKRIVVHRECGGVCTEEVTYVCHKCGETHIKQNMVFYVDEEEKDVLKGLPSMAEIEALYLYDDAYDITDTDLGYLQEVGYANEYGVITATDKQVAKVLQLPRHVKEGLEEEDIEEIDRIYKELRKNG